MAPPRATGTMALCGTSPLAVLSLCPTEQAKQGGWEAHSAASPSPPESARRLWGHSPDLGSSRSPLHRVSPQKTGRLVIQLTTAVLLLFFKDLESLHRGILLMPYK